jgi:hypothetical protein
MMIRGGTLAQRLERYSIPEPNSGCVLWTASTNAKGYGQLRWQGSARLAHRLAWLNAGRESTGGRALLHKCDVRCCINPDHLRIGTQAENNRDMVAKGRQARGEKNGQALLTEEQVRAILADPRTRKAIAAEYGLSAHTVGDVKTGRRWKHVYSELGLL